MCLDNCPCPTWTNCHYYNSFKYIQHRNRTRNEIITWYDIIFRNDGTIVDIIGNG